jgi:hypothetical protein
MANPFTFAGISMDNLERYPERINPLLPTYYQFSISRLPGVNYFCQTASLPSLTLSQVQFPTRFSTIQSPSKLTFDELTITFVVDEGINNWMEIYKWMRSTTNVDSFNEYRPDNEQSATANLLILNSSKNPKINVTFNSLYPITLSALDFTSTGMDPEPLQATCSFSYRTYDIEIL